MASSDETRSLPELLGGLAGDISSLFRKEVQLAKAEASEKASELVGGVVYIGIGAVLALGALGVLLTAIVSLISAFFIAQNMDPTLANALSAIIVTIIVGLIAYVMVQRGLGSFKGSNLNLQRTASSLGRDADVVKERL